MHIFQLYVTIRIYLAFLAFPAYSVRFSIDALPWNVDCSTNVRVYGEIGENFRRKPDHFERNVLAVSLDRLPRILDRSGKK